MEVDEHADLVDRQVIRRTVAVVDMVGYSHVARLLEENISSSSVSELNAQIQAFMSSALSAAGDTCQVVSRTGDGIIVLFQQPEAAHRFGYQVHCVAAEHNTHRTERTAQRRFRVGIATGDVTVTTSPTGQPEYAGTTIANAVRLEAAAGPGQLLLDQASFTALPHNLQTLYEAEETVKGKRDERYRVRRCRVDCKPSHALIARHRLLSRRALLGGGALLAAGAAASAWVKAPVLERWMHPLPAKRFVALLAWPPLKDAVAAPALQNTVDLVGNELTRAEAYDHDLLVMPHSVSPTMTTMAQVNELRESLGANLILAATAVIEKARMHFNFRVFDGATSKLLREATLRVPLTEVGTLPERAVDAAISLLDIRGYTANTTQPPPGTASPEAFALFQKAEGLHKLPNDEGLQPAIDAYREALERDDKFVRAYAGLALAYCRLGESTHDATVLALAKSNADIAAGADAHCVQAHMALGEIYKATGHPEQALTEYRKALAVDPSNFQTLTWQASLYTRLNRWQDAEESYGRILRQRPNYWLAHSEYAVLLDAEAKYPAALREAELANRAAPRSTLPLNNIAAILLTLGRVSEAISAAQKSLALRPNGLAAGTLAAAYRVKADYARALVCAEQATMLDPADSTTWLELGDCCTRMGRKADSASAYAEAARVQAEDLENNPTDGPGTVLLALYQAKCGRREQAAVLLKRSAQWPSKDIDSDLYRVRTLAVLGMMSEARAVADSCASRGATRFAFETMPDWSNAGSDLHT